MIVVNAKAITLDNVKRSNYWDLIALIVWHHYSEERHQDDDKVSFKEHWIGLMDGGGGSHHSSEWEDPNFTRKGYTRFLSSVDIRFERSDFVTRISLGRREGAVHYHGHYKDKDKDSCLQTYNSLGITNWMLDNGFYVDTKIEEINNILSKVIEDI